MAALASAYVATQMMTRRGFRPWATGLMVLLTCGYLYLEGVVNPIRLCWYWLDTALVVALWGRAHSSSPPRVS